jgi:hypothetical protein
MNATMMKTAAIMSIVTSHRLNQVRRRGWTGNAADAEKGGDVICF